MAAGQDSGWLKVDTIGEGEHVPAGSPGAMFELRPLSVGEILDRTFALYRSRFWLFASISAVSGAAHVIVQAVSLTAAHTILRHTGPFGTRGPVPIHTFVAAEIQSWIAALIFFLVAAITQAATSLALSEVYMNRPASAKNSLRVALKRWYRWIGIALWQAGSMLWIFAVTVIPGMILLAYGARTGNMGLTIPGGLLVFASIFGGLPVGFVLYLRNALATPAAVVEGLGIRAAMRRSKALAVGTKGRIFVVLLIAGVLYWIVGVLESPAALLMMLAPHKQHYIAQGITLAISFLGHTVVAPIALIGLTLLYFDQRVRKEALDLQLLLEHSRPSAPPTAAVDAFGAYAPPHEVRPIE